MPRITARQSFDGFDTNVTRLGLEELLAEVQTAVCGFDLVIHEARHANGTRPIQEKIDAGFSAIEGWTRSACTGVDWSRENARGSKLGVKVDVSGRNDLLAVDAIRLRTQLHEGRLDAGVIVVADDALSRYLTERAPDLRTATRRVGQHANDSAVQLLAFAHDGVGDAVRDTGTGSGKRKS